ncbi:hypothetical protein TSUD_148400 [Trifolium subterraneum]|uniref:BAT2 N-terminal domain-containing protein n=1 Tax=Trifolium subterraneum TaxID=3900 RepID=A0A2Z6NBQ4_TRISU|nr:hypothetical protein TSUD_148400 [Trifolium subterraneum]
MEDHDSHIRPGSSAGHGREKNETSTVDDVPVHATAKGETENSWRIDQAFKEDGMRPGKEKWQGNLHHHYPNAGILPQHFNAWRGAPVNNHQGDTWFRGPPNSPPFGTPVAPGGFPIQPFPFYRPNIPLTGLANSPQVPLPGSRPTGQHKNGEVYRPHMPDTYIPPGMQWRPAFYPGPMAYDGYYRPPMGYCNSNKQDIPFIGRATGPSVYNWNLSHNPPESGNSHNRSGGHGPAVKPLASEPIESSHTHDTARPYRVLLKQHNKLDGKNEPTNWENSFTANPSYANVKDQPRMPVQENDHRRNVEMDLRRKSGQAKVASSKTSGNQGSISVNNTKSLERTGSFNKFDNISERKRDGVASNTLGIASGPFAHKDSTIFQKIELLNAKARANSFTKSKEDRLNKFNAGSHVENEKSAGVVVLETTLATEVNNPTVRGVCAFGGGKNFESSSFSGTPTSRKISPSVLGRGNHRMGRLYTQDSDGWRKKSGVIDSSTSSGTQLEASNILVGEHQISIDAYERSGSYSQVRRQGESMQSLSHSANSREQRAKTKESSKQQTKQLQVEEEEWNKKQRAKSLAKLEEVNRPTEVVKGSMQKAYAASYPVQNKQEELQPSESATVSGKSGAANSYITPNDNGAGQNLSLSKTSNVSTTSGALKVENDTMAYVNVSYGISTDEASSAFVSGLPMNSISMVASSVNQKKKNNRNRKNKQKVEEISLTALPTEISKEAGISRSSVENKLKEDIKLDQGSLQSPSLSKDPNQYSEQKYSENEESYGRMNNRLKSQHSRRMPRNMQANRQAEKSHGIDAVMWAPVKPPKKIEILDESSEKTKMEAFVPAESNQQVHNLKNKRAEMERYIPKPVAKEMAQQGSQVPTHECVERVDSGSQAPQLTRHTIPGVGIVGSFMESKNGDNRQTRSHKGKAHGSWQQRNSTESNDVHESIQIPMECLKVQMSETRGQSKHANDTIKLDGLNNAENHDSAVPVSDPIINDHKAIVNERQVPFRRQKGTGVNHNVDQKNAGEYNQPDINVVLKENQSIGGRISSHWQPKFQASNNQSGNRPNKKQFTHVSVSFPDDLDKGSNSPVAQSPSQSVSENRKGRDAPNFGAPKAVRGSLNAPPEGHPLSPNQVAVSSSEQAPTSMNPRHQYHPSPGVHPNENQSRFGKGGESQGDWKTRMQDNRYHNRERQGPPNFHYEYHSVGPHGDRKSDNSERPMDGNYHAGLRFRERGQTYSRRGGGTVTRH